MNSNIITRGSLFLTDDFVQSISYNVPGQLSGFALLKLPTWSNAGMSIAAAELGLQADIVDPNILLPAVLKQYWLNLNAYARQYHASLAYDTDIEDFAEQGFWKCMKRLMPAKSYDDFAECIVAKSNDVLLNTNSVEGNLYMELLLSVDATLQKQQVQMVQAKPTYLQTIAQLPDTANAQVLGGHSKAVYDKDRDYYDISDANCYVARFSKAEQEQSAFAYNAILLYYKVGDVEQVAGIYFPNAFVQSGNYYQLPSITKQHDTALGYSINIKYAVGEAVTYIAENADIGAAMQIYNAWYKAMSNASMQIATLSKAVAEQGLQLDQLQSMYDAGLLTKLYKQVQVCQQQLATTFKGSVSTNRLLQLFTEAKQASGELNLTLLLSDLSQAITSRDIVVSNDIGSYKANDVISVGTSITDVLEKILHTTAQRQLLWPSGELKLNDTKDTLYIKYGEASTVLIAVNLTQGDAGDFALPAKLAIVSSDGEATIDITDISFKQSYVVDRATNTIGLSTRIQYADGEDIAGSVDKVFAGLLSLSARIVPVFTMYKSSIDLLEQLDAIQPADVLAWQSFASNECSQFIYGAKQYQVLAMPADVDCPIVNSIAASKTLAVNDTTYRLYAVHARYISIDTTNLQ